MRLLLVFLLLFGPFVVFSQATGDYRSFQSGPWSDVDSWERFDGATWVTPAPSAPAAGTSGAISIQSGHTITVTASVSTDQTTIATGGIVVINSGVTLTVSPGSGDDLTVNGTFTNNGAVSIGNSGPPLFQKGLIRVSGSFSSSGTVTGATTAALLFSSGAVYDHQNTSSAVAVPTASWNENSTIRITGLTSGTPVGLTQTFGNFVWDTPALGGFVDLAGVLQNIAGDLTFNNTNNNYVYFTTSTAYTLNVGTGTTGGSLTYASGALGGFTSDANVTINVSNGDFTSDSPSLFSTGTGTFTMSVGGNFSLNSGTFDLVSGSGAQDITVNGDLNLLGGTLDGGAANITMAGTGVTWNRTSGSYSSTTGTVTITGSVTVTGTQTPGFGNLSVNSGATVNLPALVNISGDLQVDAASTLNHNNGSIVFNGSTAQTFAGGGKDYFDITVNKTGGALQLTSAVNLINTLDIQTATEVQSNGSLVLVSTSDGTSGNASVMALPSGASITGNVTSQRYMGSEGRIYRYISSPVSGAAVSALQDDFPVTGAFTGASTGCSGCTTNPSMFYYDETVTGVADNGYLSFPSTANTETLTVGRGYSPFIRQNILAGPVTIDLTGTLNQGAVSLPVTYTNSGDATADGYNLVGNPYASTIDWDIVAGWTKTNVDNTIAVRDNGSGGTYLYWNGTTGTLTNGLIAAGQGFWVQATGASPVLQVNEQAKTGTTGQFYRMQKTSEEIHVLEMTLTDGRVTDKAFFQFSKDSKPEKDIFDARKLNNVGFDFYILSPDGISMAISASNKIPKKKESIRLRIKDMVKGTYKFSINASGELEQYEYFLLDRYTNTSIDLQQSPVYTFTVTSSPATFAPDRFELFLSRSTGAEESGDIATAFEVYPNPVEDRMYVKVISETVADVVLINRMGKIEERISMVNIDGDAWEGYFDLSTKENGIYFVRVIDSQGKVSTQKILKK